MPVFNDNVKTNAPKNIDDAKGVFENGVWRPYNSTAEIFEKELFLYESQEFPVKENGVITIYRLVNGTTPNHLLPVVNKIIDVREYGAKGGAVYSEANDEWTGFDNTAILRYIHAVFPNVVYPEGETFLVSDEIPITVPNAVVQGFGNVVQAKSAYAKDIFKIESDNVTVRQVGLFGSFWSGVGPNGAAASAIKSSGRDGVTVDNVRIDKQNGVTVYKGKNHNIINCKDILFSQRGIYVFGEFNVERVENVSISWCTVRLNSRNIPTESSRGINLNIARNGVVSFCQAFGAQLSFESWKPSKDASGASLMGVFMNENIKFQSCIGDRWMSLDGQVGSSFIGCKIDYKLLPANAAPYGSEYNFNYSVLGFETVFCIDTNTRHCQVYDLPGQAYYTGTQDTNISENASNGVKWSYNHAERCGRLTSFSRFCYSVGNAIDVELIGNTCKDPVAGAYVVAGGPASPITNAVLRDNSTKGGSGVGYLVYYCDDVELISNLAKGISSDGFRIGGANDSAWALNVKTINNRSYDNGGFGIYHSKTSLEHRSSGNICSGNATDFRTGGLSGLIGHLEDNPGVILQHVEPISGTWDAGTIIKTDSTVFMGKRCIESGTAGSLLNGNGTPFLGSVVAGSKILTVDNYNYRLTRGQYITIAGISGVFRVTKVMALAYELNVAPTQSTSGAKISWKNPVFIDWGRAGNDIRNNYEVAPVYTALPAPVLNTEGNTTYFLGGLNVSQLISIPSGSGARGLIQTFINRNTSGNSWSFTTNTVFDIDGSVLASIPNATVLTIVAGSNEWRVTSKYSI